jgi:hypothetical protein
VNAFADGNYNNNVDAADYVLYRKNVGHTGPAGQGAGSDEFVITTVPEPGAMMLVVSALCGLALRRRKR